MACTVSERKTRTWQCRQGAYFLYSLEKKRVEYRYYSHGVQDNKRHRRTKVSRDPMQKISKF